MGAEGGGQKTGISLRTPVRSPLSSRVQFRQLTSYKQVRFPYAYQEDREREESISEVFSTEARQEKKITPPSTMASASCSSADAPRALLREAAKKEQLLQQPQLSSSQHSSATQGPLHRQGWRCTASEDSDQVRVARLRAYALAACPVQISSLGLYTHTGRGGGATGGPSDVGGPTDFFFPAGCGEARGGGVVIKSPHSTRAKSCPFHGTRPVRGDYRGRFLGRSRCAADQSHRTERTEPMRPPLAKLFRDADFYAPFPLSLLLSLSHPPALPRLDSHRAGSLEQPTPSRCTLPAHTHFLLSTRAPPRAPSLRPAPD